MRAINSWRALWALLRGSGGCKSFEEMTNSERGRTGEKEAERHLRKKGFRIVNRNWRNGRDEIDLICMDQETLVFVEVRTRKESAAISGYHSVGTKKKRALLRVCKAYLRKRRKRSPHYRFDLVEARWQTEGRITCLHYENVALFPDRSH